MLPCCAPLQYIKEKYWEYGYQEVVTPNMFNLELWHTSGHAAHYKVPLVHCCGPDACIWGAVHRIH
jgi:glycyl-tRNA synthetase (class II)